MTRTTSRFSAAVAALAAASAIAACGSSSPNSTGATTSARGPSQAQLQRDQQDAVRFSRCMRTHGVPNFPDAPTAGNPSSGHAFKNAFNTSSPAFASADAACGHLMPAGGQPNQSVRQTHAHVTALLAFARCPRSHGFANFPDPTSNGQVTHEMIASAGINLHQPALVQSADACAGATHGIITRAIVARFIAGH